MRSVYILVFVIEFVKKLSGSVLLYILEMGEIGERVSGGSGVDFEEWA